MTRVVKRKFFFLITGSDLLFNKLDEIEHECCFSLSPRSNVQCDSDFKRYPVLSLKWLLYRFRKTGTFGFAVVLGLYSQATKRIRWMPWQSEAMKDVEACDKARGAGKQAVIRASLNGETHRSSDRYRTVNP